MTLYPFRLGPLDTLCFVTAFTDPYIKKYKKRKHNSSTKIMKIAEDIPGEDERDRKEDPTKRLNSSSGVSVRSRVSPSLNPWHSTPLINFGLSR